MADVICYTITVLFFCLGVQYNPRTIIYNDDGSIDNINLMSYNIYVIAPIAQSVERLSYEQEVPSSSLGGSNKFNTLGVIKLSILSN
jgi:hypothetical protein